MGANISPRLLTGVLVFVTGHMVTEAGALNIASAMGEFQI